MVDSSDSELLQRFRAGDETALEPLFERYEGLLFQYLFGLLKNHHAAEDVLQETFVQVLRNIDAIRIDSFRGWLFTVAHQQAILLKRRGKRQAIQAEQLMNLIADSSDPSQEKLATLEDARIVRELLARLPDSEKAVITARVFEGKKFREVADMLGCPLNTALSRMHEGVKRLRQMWDARYA